MHPSKLTTAIVLVLLGGLMGCNSKKKQHNRGEQQSTTAGTQSNVSFDSPSGVNVQFLPGLLSAVDPKVGSIYGGDTVKLTSARSLFVAGAQVFFDNVAATDVVLVASNELTAKTPAHAAGLVDVEVRLPNGNRGKLINGFTYDPNLGLPARVADYGDPTPGEQELLDLMNRARKDPTAEGQRLGLNFAAYPKAPPITHNEFLAKASLAHVNDMVTRGFYGHNNPDGVGPNGRVLDSTYDLNLFYGTNRTINLTENLGAASGNRFLTPQDVHDTFMRDEGLPMPKHREMILGYDQHSKDRETGIAYRINQTSAGQVFTQFVTEEFAYTKRNKPFIVGTVFNDGGNDGVAQAGEGRANVQVTLRHVASGFTLTTNTKAAGGYAFEVFVPGDFTITIDGKTATVTMADKNQKVDLRGATIVTQQ